MLSTMNVKKSLSEADIQLINMINRNLLFPLPKGIDLGNKLQMQVKKTAPPPKAMNSFMVFRRYLNFVVKETLRYDGKNLSRVAAYIWNEATNEQRQEYKELSIILKKQHSILYPNHVERRTRRKNRLCFVDCNKNYESTNSQLNGSCDINTTCMESQGVSCRQTNRYNVSNVTRRQEEQVNEIPFNNYAPTAYEYGNSEGLTAFIVQHQQYQQDNYPFAMTEGDLNPGFNGNFINFNFIRGSYENC